MPKSEQPLFEERTQITRIEGTPRRTEKFSLTPEEDERRNELDLIREGILMEYRYLLDEVGEMIEGKRLELVEDVTGEILKLLAKEKIDEVDDIKKREVVFEAVEEIIRKKATEELLTAFNEIDLLSAGHEEEREKRRNKLAEKILVIDRKYNLKKLFDYLELGEEKGGSFSLE